MKNIKLNKFKDCIVDENNVIVAERPHGLKEWQTGEELCRVFNESRVPDEVVLCDGCNVREGWEHRCHGENCTCDYLICMERQGRITQEEVTEIIKKSLDK